MANWSDDDDKVYTLEPKGLSIRTLESNKLIFAPIVLFVVGFIVSGVVLAVIFAVFGGMVMAYLSSDSITAALNWERAKLHVPTVAFQLGAPVQVRYERNSKKVRDISNSTVTCKLVCTEQVEYSQGTDTVKRSADVFSEKFTAPGVSTPHGLESEITIEIPTNAGAPSMRLGNNNIEWHIETSTEGDGLPGDKERFTIQVVAVLYKEPDRPQDTVLPAPERPQDTW